MTGKEFDARLTQAMRDFEGESFSEQTLDRIKVTLSTIATEFIRKNALSELPEALTDFLWIGVEKSIEANRPQGR